jgi:hypothetical protein
MVTYAQRLRKLVRILGTPEQPIGQRALAEYLGTSQVTVSHWWGGRPAKRNKRTTPSPKGSYASLILISLIVGEKQPEIVRLAASLPLGAPFSGWKTLVRVLGFAKAALFCSGPLESYEAWQERGSEPRAVLRLAVLLETCELLAPEVIEKIKGG